MEWKSSADAPPDQPGGAHLPTGTWVSVSGLSAIKAVVVPPQVCVMLADVPRHPQAAASDHNGRPRLSPGCMGCACLRAADRECHDVMMRYKRTVRHCQTQELASAAAPKQRAATPPAAVDLATVHAAARGVLQSMNETVPILAAPMPQPSTLAAAIAADSSAAPAAQNGMNVDGQAVQPPDASGDVIIRDVPKTQPPSDAASEAAALVTCCQSGRRFHLGCLSPQDQLLVRPLQPCSSLSFQVTCTCLQCSRWAGWAQLAETSASVVVRMSLCRRGARRLLSMQLRLCARCPSGSRRLRRAV